MAPPTASSTDSVNTCRTSRPRPPPSAARVAISRRRLTPRTSCRLATLTHAMSRRNPDCPAEQQQLIALPESEQILIWHPLHRTGALDREISNVALKTPSHRAELGGHLRLRRIGCQARDDGIAPGIVGWRYAKRRPEINSGRLPVCRRHDSDNRVRDAAELNRFTEDVDSAAEHSPRQVVAQDDRARAARPILVHAESASNCRTNTNNVEVSPRDRHTGHVFGLRADRKIPADCAAVCGDVFERSNAVAQVVEDLARL